MPFKSEKQRKWMYANDPEMAKKWEKEEAIKGKLRNLIKQEIKSVKEDNIKFSKEEMAQLHKDGKVEKNGHTIEFGESINEGWWEDLSDKAQAAYIKKHGGAPNSSTPEPIGKYKKGDITKQVQSDKGREIAKKMAGNMTGAVKKIEKIKKGLSDDPKVKAALRKANESVNESDLGLTYKKGKTVKVTHKKSGKELIIIDKPNVKREYEKIGYFAEGKVNEGFDKYHLGNVTDSKLSKRLQRAITVWGGKVDAVGQDYIKFRLYSSEVTKFPMLLKKLDQKKNVWIGDKRKKNIWDRRRNINKLGEAQFFRAKQMVLLPDKKMYFDPMSNNLWLMGPYGGPDLDDDPIEPRDRDYNKIIRKLSGKDRSVLKKAMRTRKRRKEATTSVSVPGYLTPNAFKNSTQKAIDVDDEDDEKNESVNEGKWSKIMRSVRKGSKSGPWSIVVYKNKKVKHQRLVKILQQIPAHYEDVKKKYPRDKIGIDDKYGERVYTESMAAPFRRRKSRGLGRVMKVGLNENINNPMKYPEEDEIDELQMAPFSSQEARLHIDADIKKMSKELGKASHDIIKMMMDGVKRGRYTPMDISRGIKEGPAKRTHFGELTFIQQLWNKVREKFRRYSKDRKLS